jgi:hypothetical protein
MYGYCYYVDFFYFSHPGFSRGRSDVMNLLREWFLKDFFNFKMFQVFILLNLWKLFFRKTNKATKQPLRFKGWKGSR